MMHNHHKDLGLLAKILHEAAIRDGSSCLTRDEIISRVQDYPLYYITKEDGKLNLDIENLIEYEKESLFKEKFTIVDESYKNGPTIYQTREVRKIENTIEQFVDKLLKKNFVLERKDLDEINMIVTKEEKDLGSMSDKISYRERQILYECALKKGFFLVSGKAGSGKTNAVVNLIRKFRNDGNSVYVLTPTGKASLVIKERLGPLDSDKLIKVSTIHRFLYTELSQYIGRSPPATVRQIFKILDLTSDILEGKLDVFDQFVDLSKGLQSRPKVVIIDEASMVDEVLLATLFTLSDSDSLQHLIVVGDEKQLPPIGIGRPFLDLLHHLKKNNRDSHYVHLESNLRFPPSARLGALADLFEDVKEPLLIEIAEAFQNNDDTLELQYFSSNDDLKQVLKNVLFQIAKINDQVSLSDMFANIFEYGGTLNLEKVQIITPRRVGNFGSTAININIIRDGKTEFTPRTKLICEQNKYTYIKERSLNKKVLALANGSLGYIDINGEPRFDDLDDFENEFGRVPGEIQKIKNEISGDFKQDRDIDFGDAITVHKAQGSDYDHVIFVIPEISPFIVRELLYTAFTRAKQKLHIVVHEKLKEELAFEMVKAHKNSAVDQRNTLLYGYKISPSKPYILNLKDGRALGVRSKVEHIIAKTIDNLGIEFEYEPNDFPQFKPDFKLSINDDIYYLEHLGSTDAVTYVSRWNKKYQLYEERGLIDNLVTTSENRECRGQKMII